MSETTGSRPAEAAGSSSVDRGASFGAEHVRASAGATEPSATQQSPGQPYDVPTGAQQYGQPPSTGYQPPVTDPPGSSAPAHGQGPQQYGQPEHGQASYAQEGFPATGSGGQPTRAQG